MGRKLIGICGRAQHGKDSVAAVLVREYGFVKVSFADALKQLALYIDPIVDCGDNNRLSFLIESYGWEKAKSNPEVRRFLQELGTGVRSIIADDVWVKIVSEKVAYFDKVVIPDVRFPNEEGFINQRNGSLWRVIRPNFDNGVDPNHPSEKYASQMLADIDIINDGTLDDLRDKVVNIAESSI